MRTPKPLMLGMMLTLAAPVAIAQAAATSAPREAPAAPRAPRAPKAPRAPRAPEAPQAPEAPRAPEAPQAPEAPSAVAPTPPLPPHAPGFFMGRAMRHAEPKARLGTQVSTMTPALRSFFGAPEDTGLLVQHVEPGSAAEAAKVQVGDVLVEVDGQRIEHVSDVRDALGDRSKGDVVEVVVVRKHKRKALKATLTSEAGPVAFVLPPMPEHHFELPPEARRFMSPEAQHEVDRELDQAREQLREVEQQLDALRESGALEAPRPPTPPTPPAAPPAGKRGKTRRGR